MTMTTTTVSNTSSSTTNYPNPHIGGEYMDYDSDYETKDDTTKGVTDVDPYSGAYPNHLH